MRSITDVVAMMVVRRLLSLHALCFTLSLSVNAFQSGSVLKHLSSPIRLRSSSPSCFVKAQPPSATLEATSSSDSSSSQSKNPVHLDAFKSTDHIHQSMVRMKSEDAEELLKQMWERYNESGDVLHVPTQATYTSVMTAWARSNQGKKAALRAEELLEEMEVKRKEFPHLSPNTAAVNAVLNAWSKSRVQVAADRCQVILQRMEDMCSERPELSPDTITFNTVIAALSRERGCERRAESLLDRMDRLNNDKTKRYRCAPDILSFNTVINCWAKSSERGAADRSEAILRHMEQRHESQATSVVPDAASYTTVIHAFSRNRDRSSPKRAEDVLSRMEESFRNGNKAARPNALSYNAIINVWAKSNNRNAAKRALEVLDLMKKLKSEEGRSDCRPDVFTYTSVIDAVAKQGTPEAAQHAESLLIEAEEVFKETGDVKMKPNVRTYTSVINAIARAKSNPERAENLLDRMQEMYKAGDNSVKPDVVSFNAVLNAWGWSNQRGKSQKAYDIYKKMVELYKCGNNRDAKPDIITCNSVLNACAFDTADNESERARIMDIVVETLEHFQAVAPQFGHPNHLTYGNVLLSIAKHMPMGELREKLAETTFWQCCKAGQMSAFVITQLEQAVTDETFSELMGPALTSKPGETLVFNLGKLPREWTRFAPKAGKKRDTRPSRKRNAPRVTRDGMR